MLTVRSMKNKHNAQAKRSLIFALKTQSLYTLKQREQSAAVVVKG